MSSWPGIPSGRGSTCAEEGCGNERRAGGWDCRPCYKQKWKRDKRAREVDPHSWSKEASEVSMTPGIERDLDRSTYAEWQRLQDEYT